MKRRLPSGLVLVVPGLPGRPFATGFRDRPFVPHDLGLVGGPPFFISWTVALKDGFSCGYTFDVPGNFASLSELQRALNKEAGYTAGGLTGGEAFNALVRFRCVFKVRV